MFDSVFILPLAVVGMAILILLCVFTLSGLAIFRRHLLPRLKTRTRRIRLYECHDAGGDGFLWTRYSLDCGERLADSPDAAQTIAGAFCYSCDTHKAV
jgi:hypothetical protein